MRSLYQSRPDYAMQLCMLWALLLITAGHAAIVVFAGTHIWAVFLAHQAEGVWASVLTFVLPGISHAYWMQHWPEMQSAVWPHTPQPLPGRGWFVWLNRFWMLTFLLVGFFAVLAPVVLSCVMPYTHRVLRRVAHTARMTRMMRPAAEKMWFSVQQSGTLLASRLRRLIKNRREP